VSELGEPLLAVLRDEEADDGGRGARGWRPHPWWAWTIALLALGTVALLVAGTLLEAANFGTSLRARTCDASPLAGLGMLACAGMLLAAAMQFARLRWDDGAVVTWDAGSLVLSLPVPALMLALTLPGVLGCSLARDIAQVGGLGDALVGTPGIALAAAGATLLGVALGAVAHVGELGGDGGSGPPPSIVELAIEEAEALRADEAAARFHGVESGE
jgi:hypothetical protein